MTECQHTNIEVSFGVVMSARGYHECPIFVCLDCDDVMPDECDDDTCDYY